MTKEAMTRVPFIASKNAIPEDQQHNFDLIIESRGEVQGPFGVLLNSPEIAGRVGKLGAYIRYESQLLGSDRELAILTTAREFDCAFEWAYHEPIAKEEGVRQEAIEVVENSAELDPLTETEAVIIQYGRELFQYNKISDQTFDDAKNYFGVQGVTELTATMGYYALIASILNAFEVYPDDNKPTLS